MVHRNVGASPFGRHTVSYSEGSTGRVPTEHGTTMVVQESVGAHDTGVQSYGPQITAVGNERETVGRCVRPLLQLEQLFDLLLHSQKAWWIKARVV